MRGRWIEKDREGVEMEMEIWCVDRWYGNCDGNEGLGIGKKVRCRTSKSALLSMKLKGAYYSVKGKDGSNPHSSEE